MKYFVLEEVFQAFTGRLSIFKEKSDTDTVLFEIVGIKYEGPEGELFMKDEFPKNHKASCWFYDAIDRFICQEKETFLNIDHIVHSSYIEEKMKNVKEVKRVLGPDFVEGKI